MGAFQRYFLNYLFHARTRQGLLFLALIGLFLSSLSLMIIQGIMGGLQRGLVARSKSYHGVGEVRFQEAALEGSWWERVKPLGLPVVRERQTEVLARNGGQVAPLILHGVDFRGRPPEFLGKKDTSGLVLGAELAQKLKTTFFSDLLIIAPASTESLMGEIPRQLSVTVSDYLLTDVPELDGLHAWVRLSFVQNLLRSRGAERWRVYSQSAWEELSEMLGSEPQVMLISWEEQNKTLVWALNLETRVMLALFTAMSLLVALAITTGLFLFFTRIRPDLASFWLLGLSLHKIERLVFSFVLQLSALSCALGLLLGVVFLLVLERFGHNLMPDIFVERSFPVQIDLTGATIAFCVPFLVSLVFSTFSFLQFRRENPSFIQLVRGGGEGS